MKVKGLTSHFHRNVSPFTFDSVRDASSNISNHVFCSKFAQKNEKSRVFFPASKAPTKNGWSYVPISQLPLFAISFKNLSLYLIEVREKLMCLEKVLVLTLLWRVTSSSLHSSVESVSTNTKHLQMDVCLTFLTLSCLFFTKIAKFAYQSLAASLSTTYEVNKSVYTK